MPIAFKLKKITTFKAVLHHAIFSATFLATPFQHIQVAEHVTSATSLATFFLLRTALHEVELSSTFCNNYSNFQSPLHSVTPLQQLVSQCFARSANQDPYYPLLGPPRSQFCELLTVPLHSVTPLFIQLQCYAIKRCETSCTNNCLVYQRL